MTKPRRVSALSSVLKEAQEYNKVTQEDEQVTPTTVKQETVKPEKQISVDTDKHLTVNTVIQKPAHVDTAERTHKQTILISEDLAFRLKVHAARRKETIASIATRAFERLLAEEE